VERGSLGRNGRDSEGDGPNDGGTRTRGWETGRRGDKFSFNINRDVSRMQGDNTGRNACYKHVTGAPSCFAYGHKILHPIAPEEGGGEREKGSKRIIGHTYKHRIHRHFVGIVLFLIRSQSM